MRVRAATKDDLPRWLSLAAEVEPIFQGSMVENKEFHDYMNRKIGQGEAIVALDADDSDAWVGIIGFSRTYNRITWFGVFERSRNQGAGSALLKAALDRLDRTRATPAAS